MFPPRRAHALGSLPRLVCAAALGAISLGATIEPATDHGLPDPGFQIVTGQIVTGQIVTGQIVTGQTALAVTDPQNDCLSPEGVARTVEGALETIAMFSRTPALPTDVTAAAQPLGLDGDAAAPTSLRMIARHVADTETVVAEIRATAR
jgi:hypothetical protein